MRGRLFKRAFEQISIVSIICTSCITLSFAFHHFCDPSYIHPNCLWFSLFTLFHFYSAEIYFTYTNYCLCMFFVNYTFSILLSSCFLSPHPIHASSLLSSKNVNHWKMRFFSINQSKTCRTSHYLNDVTCHLLYYIPHVVSLTSVKKLAI